MRVLTFDWHESGMTGIVPPTRRGFGRELIEKAMRFTLKARFDLIFNPDGVSCRIELSLPAPGQAAIRD